MRLIEAHSWLPQQEEVPAEDLVGKQHANALNAIFPTVNIVAEERQGQENMRSRAQGENTASKGVQHV